jgi:TetR/AcrR family transcriptional regulator
VSILAAGRRIFSQKGFAGVSTQEIADAAGVNKRLIFYYFGSKEDLYLAVMEAFFQKLSRLLDNFCVTPEDLSDPWLSLLRFSDNFIHFASLNQEPVRILLWEIMNEGKTLDLLTERYIRPIFQAGENYLGHLVSAGHARNREVQHLLLSFGGANLLYFLVTPLLARMWKDHPLSPAVLEERKREMRRFILRSL